MTPQHQRTPSSQSLSAHPGPRPLPTHNVPVGVVLRDALVLDVAGEAFVQPQVVPPVERHQVSEPLVGQLVRYHGGDPLVVVGRAAALVVQQVGLPVTAARDISN